MLYYSHILRLCQFQRFEKNQKVGFDVINMNLREIIMDAIKYPISDTRKFLIFCVLIILMSLSTVIPSYGIKDGTVSIILTLVTLIVSFVVLGYSVEVIKGGTEGEATLPDFDYVKHFVMGVKALVLEIIYFIIPAILVIIVASATGLFSSFTKIVYVSIDAMANNTSNLTKIMAAVPQSTPINNEHIHQFIDNYFNCCNYPIYHIFIDVIYRTGEICKNRKRNRRSEIQGNIKGHVKDRLFKNYSHIDCNLYNCIGFVICHRTDRIDSIHWRFHKHFCWSAVYNIVFIQSYRFIVCRCITLNHFFFFYLKLS